jgi:hypothetical protein
LYSVQEYGRGVSHLTAVFTTVLLLATLLQIQKLGIFWRWKSSAWMTYSIMIDWLKWFDQRAGRPVLLLMDNFSAHQVALELIEESSRPLKWTRIEWFPANTTCLYQTLDQGIIQHWKCLVKRELLLFFKG